MADETEFFTKAKESSVFGVSIRGWITVVLVVTVCSNQLLATATACYLALTKNDISFLGSQSSITEPLYGAIYMAIGYYFAKSTMTPVQTKPTIISHP